MAGSAFLHAAILIGGLIAWPWLSKPIHMGDVVPVTLINADQAPAPAPAVQAPEPAPVQTETPVPQAPREVAAPEEEPTPAPPIPKAAPKPVPKPHPTPVAKAAPPQPQPTPKPTPQKPTPAKATSQKAAPAKPKAKPQADMDWAAVAAGLTSQARPSGPKQSSAARGATRPAQATVARTTAGVSDSNFNAAQASLSGELNRIWNPICNTANSSGVVIKVTFKIGSTGVLVGSPQSSLGDTTDMALRVASERAVRSVYQHGPFADPAYRALYGQNITVNFSQKKDCLSQ